MFTTLTTWIRSADKVRFQSTRNSQGPLVSCLPACYSTLPRITLLVFFVTIAVKAFNQSQPIDYRQQLNLPTVTPVSPDAASIEKFGNIPVSFCTGVPDISIPLYTINCGNLSWPFSLSYHAGGIRVDETAASAGLGWAINGIGVISRSRAGRPDEETPYEPIYTSVTENDFEYLYMLLKGQTDSEQDVFNFNFNGKSGKFVINQDGSVLQIPLSNLKISYTNTLSSFTIIDENGITYVFDHIELTSAQSFPSEAVPTNFTSSWFLTKVEMPDKTNTIQFAYGFAGQSHEFFPTFSQAVGRKYYPAGSVTDPPMYSDLNERSSSSMAVHTSLVKLMTINFPNGSVVFTYDSSPRKDVGSGTDVTNKLSAVIINQVINGTSTQIKRFNFLQSYFFYNPTNLPVSNTNIYRLKLDGLDEFGGSNSAPPKKYLFEYNTTPMVPRGNYGQDIWGYNNGQYNNPSLLQNEIVTFNGGDGYQTFQIGDANRIVDTNQMKACMLSSITYPTGGQTTFTFDANMYSANQTLTTTIEKETHVAGNQPAPQVSTTTFTFPSTADLNSSRVIVNMSMYNFPGVTQPSWVSIKDLTTGSTFYVQSQQNPNQSVSWDEYISLQHGHNYELKANVYSNNSNAQLTASIKIRWSQSTSEPDVRKGGGLHIREIKHYSRPGVLAGTTTYLYSTAVTLTHFANIERTYSEVVYRLGVGTDGLCFFHYSPTCRVYSSSPVYARSTAMGSPMLYQTVQTITTDPVTGATNGMSEYRYDVFRDETFPAGGRYIMVPFLSNDWMNGFLESETHYKLRNGIYSPVKTVAYMYNQFNVTQSYSLRIDNNFIREGCVPYENATTIAIDATHYLFPIRSGSKRLGEQIETVYDDNQNKIETHTYNLYESDKYDFATKTTLIDSKGNSNYVTFSYSPDFSNPGNVYEKMQQRNILAPIIEQKSYSNTTLLSTVKNNYQDWKNDGKVISLESVQASTFNNPLETRLRYYNYDIANNPLSVGKAADVKMSYIWDYNKTYPIAEVTNAGEIDIAYTSFEADGLGNWNFNPLSITSSGITGLKSFQLSTGNSVTNSNLSLNNEYVLSFWSKNNVANISGTNILQSKTGKTINGWTFHEYIITATGTLTISGSALIDELRVYPRSAQMTTFTYQPLIGQTGKCDVNNKIIYFEYDSFNRLSMIRDEDGNILKTIAYKYQEQQ